MTYADSPYARAEAIRRTHPGGGARAELVAEFNARYATTVPPHLRGALSPYDWFRMCDGDRPTSRPQPRPDERPHS